MNTSLNNQVTFSTFEKAIKNALPLNQQEKFSSFFTSVYKVDFDLPQLGHIKIETKKISDRFTFQVLEVYPTQDTILDVTAKKATVGFSFYVSGKANGYLVDKKMTLPMVADTGIICVSNYGRSQIHFTKNQPFVNINLFILSKHFIDFMGKSFSFLPNEFQMALQDDSIYYGIGGATKAEISQHLWDLRNDNFTNHNAAFLRESTALNIMGIQLSELVYDKKKEKAEDIRKIQLAHDIIKNSLMNPPKVKALAQQVGLSEFKLKNGFKNAFKMPIYTFLIDCRMKKAVELLTKKGYSVKETAYDIGYSNPNAFSNAFLKKYGVYPTEFVKNQTVYKDNPSTQP